MARILILTTEPLPLPGMPTTGAGLRAWGLAQGLRAAGLEVRLLMPADAAATFGATSKPDAQGPLAVGTFQRGGGQELARAVEECQPDAIVLQHWGLARELSEVTVPLAIDLAGPHLLERRLWGSPDPEADLREKLDALRRADFVTCSGAWQRLYFLPYLAMAGWTIEEPGALPVIPFCMAPAATPAPARGDRFIYGGFFLPWQDPSAALEAALEAMDEAGRGELIFIGGPHPRLDVSRGKFEPLLNRLAGHPRVQILPPTDFASYQRLLAEGGVALDLMARNAERELAFTTRTVVYLAAGLPVIHDNYSELGDLIADSGAGWALDPADRAGLKNLVRSVLDGREDLASRAQSARQLVDEKLHWEKTIGLLAEFCKRPALRDGKTAHRMAFEERGRRVESLEQELDATRRELATLRGKRWVRWGLRLASGGGIWRLPMAAAAVVIGLALVPVFWINDRLARGQKR